MPDERNPLMPKTLSVPRVHLNGTSKTELQEQIYNAFHALRNARETFTPMAPHMRDYYVLLNGDELFKQARSEHSSRVARIEEILTELIALYHAVDNGDTTAEIE